MSDSPLINNDIAMASIRLGLSSYPPPMEDVCREFVDLGSAMVECNVLYMTVFELLKRVELLSGLPEEGMPIASSGGPSHMIPLTYRVSEAMRTVERWAAAAKDTRG